MNQVRDSCPEHVKNLNSTTESNPVQNWAQDCRYFSKKDTQMAGEHIKGCAFAISDENENQNEDHLTPIRMTVRGKITIDGQGVEKREHRGQLLAGM